jgi:hypothetical protein
MNQERLRILELLEQGKITAAEAAELLRALGDDAGARRPERGQNASGDRPRWFRVRVTDVHTGRSKANVSIPYGMVNFGLRFAPSNFHVRAGGGPHHMDDLLSALRTGRRGTIFDVTDKSEGDRIEIILE